MRGLEFVVVIGGVILLTKVVAHKTRIAQPLLLVATGTVIGLIPVFGAIRLPPEVVLFLFLPALLYWESLTTSLREIRSNLRGIILMSTGLVVATAAGIAACAHLLGLPWGPAWVLGAALAPTDATAAGSLTRSLPHRNVTILKAESLINDGTALVLYALAVAFSVGHAAPTVATISLAFLIAYLGGAVAGGLVAWLAIIARRRLHDPLTQNVASLITPFAAYLIAETVHASGVLAVVVAGLAMSQAGPRIGIAESRRQSDGFWGLSTFILNGSLFVLVGIELPAATRGLASTDLWRGLITVAAISTVIIAIRFGYLFTTAYLIRLFDRRPQQRPRRLSNRSGVVSGFAGFRGAVSLAAVLAVPVRLNTGAPFPGREFIVFVTTGVIVVTLVVQGLILPGVVRWARLPHDSALLKERRLAETKAAQAALSELPRLAAGLGIDKEVSDRVINEYEERLAILEAAGNGDAEQAILDHDAQATQLRLGLLAARRQTVLRLRDERRIDDVVLREIQRRLDVEEVRLSAGMTDR
jgi:CPA1 family monovalent cation:H+ antiporter